MFQVQVNNETPLQSSLAPFVVSCLTPGIMPQQQGIVLVPANGSVVINNSAAPTAWRLTLQSNNLTTVYLTGSAEWVPVFYNESNLTAAFVLCRWEPPVLTVSILGANLPTVGFQLNSWNQPGYYASFPTLPLTPGIPFTLSPFNNTSTTSLGVSSSGIVQFVSQAANTPETYFVFMPTSTASTSFTLAVVQSGNVPVPIIIDPSTNTFTTPTTSVTAAATGAQWGVLVTQTQTVGQVVLLYYDSTRGINLVAVGGNTSVGAQPALVPFTSAMSATYPGLANVETANLQTSTWTLDVPWSSTTFTCPWVSAFNPCALPATCPDGSACTVASTPAGQMFCNLCLGSNAATQSVALGAKRLLMEPPPLGATAAAPLSTSIAVTNMLGSQFNVGMFTFAYNTQIAWSVPYLGTASYSGPPPASTSSTTTIQLQVTGLFDGLPVFITLPLSSPTQVIDVHFDGQPFPFSPFARFVLSQSQPSSIVECWLLPITAWPSFGFLQDPVLPAAFSGNVEPVLSKTSFTMQSASCTSLGSSSTFQFLPSPLNTGRLLLCDGASGMPYLPVEVSSAAGSSIYQLVLGTDASSAWETAQQQNLQMGVVCAGNSTGVSGACTPSSTSTIVLYATLPFQGYAMLLPGSMIIQPFPTNQLFIAPYGIANTSGNSDGYVQLSKVQSFFHDSAKLPVVRGTHGLTFTTKFGPQRDRLRLGQTISVSTPAPASSPPAAEKRVMSQPPWVIPVAISVPVVVVVIIVALGLGLGLGLRKKQNTIE